MKKKCMHCCDYNCCTSHRHTDIWTLTFRYIQWRPSALTIIRAPWQPSTRDSNNTVHGRVKHTSHCVTLTDNAETANTTGTVPTPRLTVSLLHVQLLHLVAYLTKSRCTLALFWACTSSSFSLVICSADSCLC